LNPLGISILLRYYTFTDPSGRVQQMGSGGWILLSLYRTRISGRHEIVMGNSVSTKQCKHRPIYQLHILICYMFWYNCHNFYIIHLLSFKNMTFRTCPETSSFYWAHLSVGSTWDGDRIQSSKRLVKKKTGCWTMSKIVIVILIQHHHKPIHLCFGLKYVKNTIPIQDNTDTGRHPCLKWNSNPRFQWLRGRRNFVP
jgi:hypothetical protein